MATNKCIICGAEFETIRNQAKLCSYECRLVHQRNTYRLRKEGLLPSSNGRTKKINPNQELVRLSMKAREHGMSYGKYVAMIEMGAR